MSGFGRTTETVGKLYFTSEQNKGDFTLYFLGYDHDGISKRSTEEKAKARFNREGMHAAVFAMPRIHTRSC